MRILDRYLLSEMALPFITGVLAIIVMLVSNTLFQIVDLILKNNIPISMVARMIVYNIPSLVVLTLPVGMAISASFTVNRMARDSELTAIRMSGVSLSRIFLPILLVGVLVSVTSFLLDNEVVPWSEKAFVRLQSEMFGYAMVASPQVVSDRVFTYQDYSFFVKQAEPVSGTDTSVLRVEGVTIFQNPDGNLSFPRLITAQSALYDHGLWKLKDVIVHTLDNQGFTRYEAHADTMQLDIRAPIPMVNIDENVGFTGTSENYSMSELGQQIDVLVKTGQNATRQKVDYQFKLSLPFLCLAFAICAPPLALRFSRAGSFIGIFLSIVMVFVAWNTLLLTKAFGISGHLDPFFAAWAPDILFAAIGVYLLAKSE